MERLDIALAEVITNLQQLSPEIADATLRGVRWDGVLGIVGSLLMISIGVGIIWLAISMTATQSQGEMKDSEGVLSLIGIAFCLFGVLWFFMPFKWIAAFDPEAALARKILEKL